MSQNGESPRRIVVTGYEVTDTEGNCDYYTVKPLPEPMSQAEYVEADAYDRLRSLTVGDPASVYAEVARYRKALREIVAQDPVENALDPQWSARVAEAALLEPTEASDA